MQLVRTGDPIKDFPEFHAATVRCKDQWWDVFLQHLGIKFDVPPRAVLDPHANSGGGAWLPGQWDENDSHTCR